MALPLRILRGAAASSAAGMPAGAVGIWYADSYNATANAIPSAVAGASPNNSYLRGARRMFSNSLFWSNVLCTAVDDATTAPDGTTEASTITAAGNFIVGFVPTVTLPAGTYIAVVSVKRNTGTDQPIKIGEYALTGTTTTVTATATWQRLSHTFTTTGGAVAVQIRSWNGSTGADIQVCDFDLFAGSVDLGPTTADSNLYLGGSKTSSVPVVSGNELDMTGANARGLIQLQTAQSLASFTALALVSKTAAGTGIDTLFSKVQAYNDWLLPAGQSNSPLAYIDGQRAMQTGPGSGLWALTGQGYHVITWRYDAASTQLSLWVDDVKLFTKVGSIPAATVRDVFVGIYALGSYSGLKFNSQALYASALSESQIRQAVTAMIARATLNGLSAAPIGRLLVAEGDSITHGGNTGETAYPFLYPANASPAVLGNRAAVGGAIIGASGDSIGTNSLWGRLNYQSLPASVGSRKMILSVLIGANDLTNYGTTTLWLQALAGYLDQRRALGWKVVLCTLLPATEAARAGYTARRAVANPELRLWTTGGSLVPGVHADYICDFAADATIGPDAAAANATYYSDGLHPTQAGQDIMETIYRSVVNAI